MHGDELPLVADILYVPAPDHDEQSSSHTKLHLKFEPIQLWPFWLVCALQVLVQQFLTIFHACSGAPSVRESGVPVLA